MDPGEIKNWYLIKIETKGKRIEIEDPFVSYNHANELVLFGTKYERSNDGKRREYRPSPDIRYSDITNIEFLVSKKSHKESEGLITKIIVVSIVVIILLQLKFCQG